MLDVYAVAVPDGENRYEARWSQLLEATIPHIQGMVERGTRPDGVLGSYYDEALNVLPEEWEAALHPLGDCLEKMLDRRAVAMEIARLWFTESLHRAHGGGAMTLHLVTEDDYKLYPDRDQLKSAEDRQLFKFLGLKVLKGK